MSNYHQESNLAIELLKNATKITEWFRKEGFKSYQKQDDSPVTLADFTTQIYIISRIKELFPNDRIIAEESLIDSLDKNIESQIRKCFQYLHIGEIDDLKEALNYRGPNSNRQWTIDPIDGTKGYQEGLSYATGIGFIDQSDLIMSVIGIPNYNEKGLAIFVAEKDQGAKASYGNRNFIPIKVSKQKDLRSSKMCHSLHYDKPWVMKFAEISGIKNLVQMDSMAKFCMVADGSADLYIKPMSVTRSFIWDFLPGDLMVKEAGGIVTDLNLNFLKYKDEKCIISSEGIVASNLILHDEILNIIKQHNLLETQ